MTTYGVAAYMVALPPQFRQAVTVPTVVPAPVRLNGVVSDHHDGDSFFVRLLVAPFGEEVPRQEIRILGAAARELADPGGPEAAEALRTRPGMTVGSPVVLSTVGFDKFGKRLDAVVTYLAADGQPHDLATDLIADNWCVAWNGKGVQPKPLWPRPTPTPAP